MRRVKKILRVIVSVTGIYYFVVVAAGLLSYPQSADIAVVLGNEVLKNGVMSDRLKSRVDCALALYRDKMVPLIMVSGGMSRSGFDEAITMANHLVRNGVPAADIIVDSKGINTMATAINTAEQLNCVILKAL